jgi:hypothetical protein
MAARMEKTKTPGIYKRGSRYVVVWEHPGVSKSSRSARWRRRVRNRASAASTVSAGRRLARHSLTMRASG